jgi:hypothetical protein
VTDGRHAIATLELLMLVACFSNFRRYRYLIGGLLAYAVTTSFLVLHSRSAMSALLVASVILYNRKVRPLTGARSIILGVGLLALILTFGVLRTVRDNPIGEEPRFVW